MENNGLIKYQGGLIKHVGNAISITNKLLSVDFRKLEIMHLDDHDIFIKGVSNCILRKFPNANTKHIHDGDEALKYVSECLKNNIPLDLIITDMRHPGLNGIDFSKAVREVELEYNRKIPILGIDMYDDEVIIQKILNVGFIKYLTSVMSCEEINFVINNML